jgi:predicted amidohydrolase
MTIEPDHDRALDRAAALIEEAAGAGAQLAVLPERFAHWAPDSGVPTMAEPVPGPLSGWLAAQARAHGIYLVGGSMLERVAGTDLPYNTSLLIGPNGEELGRYRKIHLFDAVVDGVRHGESDTVRGGEDTSCVPTPIGTIGLTICYDLRFPELFRALADAGMTL